MHESIRLYISIMFLPVPTVYPVIRRLISILTDFQVPEEPYGNSQMCSSSLRVVFRNGSRSLDALLS